MNILTVKDNTMNLKEDFAPVKNIVNLIADKTLEQLEKEGVFIFPELLKEATDITEDQMVLRSINNYYAMTNVMGFLGYGNERLVIESRFNSNQQDYFIQYMLEKVLDFPNVLKLSTNVNKEKRLLNLLLYLFPYYLKKAMRKGTFKKYTCNEYNDDHIKGTINISRHIKKNTPFIGNISYKQREFSYDNYVMELLRHTIEFIKRKPYGNMLLRKVKDEVSSVVAATGKYTIQDKRKIIQQNKKKPIIHAYYHEYRALQRLCILILQEERHELGSGMSQVHGVLFDGAWLWEEYVNSLIHTDFYHPMNKGGQGAQRLFSSNSRKIGLIYPDFISKNSANRVIADAKYKPRGNIGNKDYLQVLAYMFRFEARKGFYLYPDESKENNVQLKMNQGITYEKNVFPREDIKIIKCGLTIPNDVESYKEFVIKINKNEKIFIEKLTK
ncbi:hypothetical protein DKB98_11480 [Enterococcus faecalis]|uniref:5-methylcytosine restriction system specificity protein McrC n=2 Tax=Enterococcus faecalis TaxID=1351 RepID=UPI000D6749F6|nr:hypothetical protein [Enterococcus faecalis]PWI84543.1 hypothetical protein DKC02_12305 [Enterococcus faecalis]PWI88879.1 hypothetical protein DKB98_11480 [Enterococcus faecalis]PWI92890.1 hypothetical protein DKC03_03375 [Enterococcus faecalis]HCT8102886.1 hypothetical protein [Enterococcus faecalis]HEQ3564954.1 hypothetical protein [Enterococcus faecalis]